MLCIQTVDIETSLSYEGALMIEDDTNISNTLYGIELNVSEDSNEEDEEEVVEEETNCIKRYSEAIDTTHKLKRFAERHGNLTSFKFIFDLKINFQDALVRKKTRPDYVNGLFLSALIVVLYNYLFELLVLKPFHLYTKNTFE